MLNRFVQLGLVVSAFLIFAPAWAGAPGVINYYNAICDPNYPTHCAAPTSGGNVPITGSVTTNLGLVGGYEFNTSVLPTVQNAAYAAGQSLGGLQTISIGSTNGLSGILTQIRVASKGGSTVGMVAYVWDKNPTNTTCTDKTNFVASQTDDQRLINVPILLSPALSVSAQDTSTRAQQGNLTANFVNSSSNTDLYLCLLANAAVTPATTTDLRINIQGIKDQP